MTASNLTDRLNHPHGVSALAFRDGKVLACKRRKGALWGYPGGKVDPGESPQEALLREVREETGISLSLQNASFLYEGICASDGPAGRPYWVYAFICQIPDEMEPVPMAGEPPSCWMEPREFLRLSAFQDFNRTTLLKAGFVLD